MISAGSKVRWNKRKGSRLISGIVTRVYEDEGYAQVLAGGKFYNVYLDRLREVKRK